MQKGKHVITKVTFRFHVLQFASRPCDHSTYVSQPRNLLLAYICKDAKIPIMDMDKYDDQRPYDDRYDNRGCCIVSCSTRTDMRLFSFQPLELRPFSLSALHIWTMVYRRKTRRFSLVSVFMNLSFLQEGKKSIFISRALS